MCLSRIPLSLPIDAISRRVFQPRIDELEYRQLSLFELSLRRQQRGTHSVQRSQLPE